MLTSLVTGKTGAPGDRTRTTSSTAPAWRPTSPSTACWPTCWPTAAPGATRSAGSRSNATSRSRGRQSGDGALYASGATTLGGYFPGVDTFLGLQVAAQEIADDLARRGSCRRIGPVRSTAQWFKWALNRKV